MYDESYYLTSLRDELKDALKAGNKDAAEPIFLQYLQNVSNREELEVMIELANKVQIGNNLNPLIVQARFRVDFLAMKTSIKEQSGLSTKEKVMNFLITLKDNNRPIDGPVLTAIYNTFEAHEIIDFIDLSNLITLSINPGDYYFNRVLNIEIAELQRMLDESSQETEKEQYDSILQRIKQRRNLITTDNKNLSDE